MEAVLYKRHPTFNHLFCGSNGEIWTISRGRFLTRKTTVHGYVYVKLYKCGKMAHRLICEAHYGFRDGLEVNHKNSIRNDNRIENLEWVTKSENAIHSFKYGFNSHKGDKNSRSVLKSTDIPEIIRMRNSGLTYVEISKKYGVCAETISAAYNKKTWN